MVMMGKGERDEGGPAGWNNVIGREGMRRENKVREGENKAWKGGRKTKK